MRKFIILLFVLYLLGIPVRANEFIAPSAPKEAQQYMPTQQKTFGEDLWYIIREALPDVLPTVHSATKICISVLAICIITAILKNMTNLSVHAVELMGAVAVAILLLTSTKSFITLAVDTVTAICEYGKLFFPVMAGALAAEGGSTTSTSLYTGTVIFNTFLTTGLVKVIVPALYAYLAISIVLSSYTVSILTSLKNFIKWFMTWSLKISIFLFTGYLGITKIISGSTDAIALKATKMTIAGIVPVVGGMISDASETVLLSVGIMKNTAGIYGVITLISISIVPFMIIGVQSILLKLTEGLCGLVATKSIIAIIHDIAFCMDFLLAVTGTVCTLLIVSTVCFMKGVS